MGDATYIQLSIELDIDTQLATLSEASYSPFYHAGRVRGCAAILRAVMPYHMHRGYARRMVVDSSSVFQKRSFVIIAACILAKKQPNLDDILLCTLLKGSGVRLKTPELS